MEIALFEPEIPPNTGNIARLCVNTGLPLAIIGKPGFSLTEKALRRAGLDYWHLLDFSQYSSWEDYRAERKSSRILCFSKFGVTNLWNVQFQRGDCLLFGRETKGLPEEILCNALDQEKIFIPMAEGSRSINLSNAVAIAAYEALRQLQ